MAKDTRSVYQVLARSVNHGTDIEIWEVQQRGQTLTPETLNPETLQPETLNPETLTPERLP
jgi:hypothetical protein